MHSQRPGKGLLGGNAGRQQGFDAAAVHFEQPVATGCCGAGQVVRRGHIGAGQCRQVGHQRAAGVTGGHVAAVDQQVGAGCQRVAPGRQITGALQRCGGVEPGGAELQGAVAAVADQVDRGQAAALGQRAADHGQAVIALLQQHHVQRPAGGLLGLQVGQQQGRVGQRGVDEDDLGGCLCSRLGFQRGLMLGQRRSRAAQQQRRQVGRMQQPRL